MSVNITTDTGKNISIAAKTPASAIPSNEQIKGAIQQTQSILQEQHETNTNLNDKGRAMASGAHQFLEATQDFLETRNSDEMLQRFAQHASSVAKKAKDAAADPQTKGDMKDAWTKVSQIAPKLRMMITDIFTSHEFERLLLETFQIFASVFSKIKNQSGEGSKMDNISEEDKKQMAEKMTQLHAKVGKKEKFKEYRKDFLELFQYFSEMAQQHSERSDLSTLQKEMQSLYYEGLEVLQRFVGDQINLRDFSDKCFKLMSVMKNDSEARDFMKSWQDWANTVVNHPDQAESEENKNKAYSLINQGIHIIRHKYGDDIRELLQEAQNAATQLMQNNKPLADSILKMRHVFAGSLLDTMSQLRYLAAPIIKDAISSIPIPDVSESDDKQSFSLTNMTLSGPALNIDDMRFRLTIGMKDVLEAQLNINNIHIELNDCDFSYEHKSFPNYKDSGKCSAKIESGKWYFKWVVKEDNNKNTPPYFALEKISCPFSKFNFHVDEAKHPKLDNLALTLFNTRIKNKTQEAIETNLRKYSDKLTIKFNEFFNKIAVIPGGEKSAEELKKIDQKAQDKIKTKTGSTAAPQTQAPTATS